MNKIKLLRRTLGVITTTVTLCLGNTAFAFDWPFSAKHHSKIYIGDITPSSSATEDINKICRPSFQRFLQALEVGDEVSLLVVTDRAASKDNFRVTVNTPDTGYSTKDRQALMQSILKLKTAHKEFASTNMISTNGSRILDGIALSVDKLNVNTGKKSLYICSDGIENSQYGSFDNKNFDPDATLKSLPSALKPAMNGVDVYWFGLGGVDAVRWGKIEEFWKNYFQNTGATIKQLSRAPLN